MPEQAETSLWTDGNWAYISLVPCGFGSWAPVYAGIRARNWPTAILGTLFMALVLVGILMTKHSAGAEATAGTAIVVGWVGSVATSFAARDATVRAHARDQPLQAGKQRLAERERLRKIARTKPALARELGVGRPDRPGAHHGGLVDINHATEHELTTLPGISPELAGQIRTLRGTGMNSVEELGSALDLDAITVEELRDLVVFVPVA